MGNTHARLALLLLAASEAMAVGVAVSMGGGVAVAVATGAKVAAPARSALHYPWALLADEAETMNGCVECHAPDKFHTCDSCHDDHGSAEMANVPFDDLILLQGDVPQPGYIPVNDILPYREQPGTHVTLLEGHLTTEINGVPGACPRSPPLTSSGPGFVSGDVILRRTGNGLRLDY